MTAAATTDVLRVACPACLTTNRVRASRAAEGPKCGRCGAPLLDGSVREADAATLDALVERTDLPVVADFWAPWCGPCRAMAPMFAEAARRLASRARFVKVNTDEHPALAARYGIRAVPTLILFRDGREAKRQAGAMDAGSLVRWIES
ncbi:MAG: thioredoxin TrxC [Burkholderiales bacterium]|nr:thioredoxin TrxC [Burkholderiales bacterium]